MSVILINGSPLPDGIECIDYDCDLKDMDGAEGTGRSESTGVLFRDRIGRVRVLKLGIGPSTVAGMSALLKMVDNDFVQITYLDSHDGDWRTDEFHVTDRGCKSLVWDCELVPGSSKNLSKVRWAPTTLEFVGRGNPIGAE